MTCQHLNYCIIANSSELRMKRILTIVILIILSTQLCQAQFLYSTKRDSSGSGKIDFVPDNELVKNMNPQKPLWLPVVESIGMNLGLGAFNAFITKSEFAKISFKTVKHNHEIGWTTDADAFLTNMWAHPFHGSIYFNLTRSSGYNYWTSMGVAAIGSWQWEFFMENEPPAFNDWVMTSVGGSMLGEMFYRFSNLILDESLTGAKRFWNELAAGIYNPGRLFNRLVYGRTSRVTSKELYEKRPFLGELGLGINNIAEGTDFKTAQQNAMLTLDYAYGKLFEMGTFKPFDFFRFNMALNFGGVQPIVGQFRIYAMLHGRTTTFDDESKFIWGFFQHYDYLESNIYQVGGASAGLGVGYRSKPNQSFQFIGMLHGAAMLMGAANSDYSQYFKVSFLDSARSYNMGPGAHAKLETYFRFPFGSFYLGYSFWWINTWDGAPGDEFIGMLSPKLRIHLAGNWFIGLEYLLYQRFGIYEEFDNQTVRNNEQRLFFSYAF